MCLEDVTLPRVSVKHAAVNVSEHPQERSVHGVSQHQFGCSQRKRNMKIFIFRANSNISFKGKKKKKKDSGGMGALGDWELGQSEQ